MHYVDEFIDADEGTFSLAVYPPTISLSSSPSHLSAVAHVYTTLTSIDVRLALFEHADKTAAVYGPGPTASSCPLFNWVIFYRAITFRNQSLRLYFSIQGCPSFCFMTTLLSSHFMVFILWKSFAWFVSPGFKEKGNIHQDLRVRSVGNIR